MLYDIFFSILEKCRDVVESQDYIRKKFETSKFLPLRVVCSLVEKLLPPHPEIDMLHHPRALPSMPLLML